MAMTPRMRCGIEFEYLIVDLGGHAAGRIRDFLNLDFATISAILADKPGRDDPELATGDLGIKSGYWYLEGDERFDDNGVFRALEVKGVEIRTPPAPSVAQAVTSLLEIERQLTRVLARHGLGLAVAGFNPIRSGYDFVPPLNPWEQALRRQHRAYDGSHISTLSYGPDINLSMPGWKPEQCLEAARKLNWYSPFIVPFSFSSPFFAEKRWHGWSKRTYERASQRPAVKLFLDENARADLGAQSTLVHPTRLATESGRVEFKAFDAHLSAELLTACCHLLEGICLADDLPGRGEQADLVLYRQAALAGFEDDAIQAGAAEVLTKARAALLRAGAIDAAQTLSLLARMLNERSNPARDLLAEYRGTGLMYRPGGHLRQADERTSRALEHASP